MIIIELVNPTTLGDAKLSFDKKQIESQDFTGKSGQQINLINNTGEAHHILFGLEDGDSSSLPISHNHCHLVLIKLKQTNW